MGKVCIAIVIGNLIGVEGQAEGDEEGGSVC